MIRLALENKRNTRISCLFENISLLHFYVKHGGFKEERSPVKLMLEFRSFGQMTFGLMTFALKTIGEWDLTLIIGLKKITRQLKSEARCRLKSPMPRKMPFGAEVLFPGTFLFRDFSAAVIGFGLKKGFKLLLVFGGVDRARARDKPDRKKSGRVDYRTRRSRRSLKISQFFFCNLKRNIFFVQTEWGSMSSS